jgi:ABC-type polysaccharide/polyol phosphate export permease
MNDAGPGVELANTGLFGGPVSGYPRPVAIGMIVWAFIITAISKGCDAFVGSA